MEMGKTVDMEVEKLDVVGKSTVDLKLEHCILKEAKPIY